MDLDTLLQPLGWRDFERSYFRKTPVVLTGHSTRFAHLATNDKLNAVLGTHRFTPRRLAFVKAGTKAPRESYLWKFREEAAQVRADGVKQLIDAGYHLSLDAVDELWPDVRGIAEAWERAVGSYVGVNLYAAWTGQQGLKVHVDGHDTLLLQVAGSKRWSVYAPDAEIDTSLEEQNTQPVLAQVIRPGQLLYIPKGWWHVGRAEGGHSVHLTVGIDGDPTSLFLQWCVREWKARAWAARPLPWPDAPTSIDAFLADLTEALRRELTPECFRRFRYWKDSSTAVRPRLAFEHAAGALPLADGSLIRWRSQVEISDTADAKDASLEIDGQLVPIPPALVPAVRRIPVWPPITWRDLSATTSALTVSPLEHWISAMALGGHLTIEGASEPSSQAVAAAVT